MVAKKFSKLILTLFVLSSLLCSALFMRFSLSKATSGVSLDAVFPLSGAETKSLDNPKGAVYLNDGRIATIQGNNVVFLLPDGTEKVLGGFTSPKQLKTFGSDYILVSNSGTLRKISLSDYSVSDLTYDNNGSASAIGGNYFDLNETHLITAYGSALTIYKLGNPIVIEDDFGEVKGDCPIALSDGGKVIYHRNGEPRTLCISTLEDFTSSTTIAQTTVTDVITFGDYFFYIESGKIYRRSLATPSNVTELTVGSSTKFDLGRLSSPVSMSVKGDNLFVTDDSLDAVQEFRVENDKLYFTGYAVASGKTAFNRISSPSLITSLGNTFAAVDATKLTVIKKLDGDFYDESNFVNLLLTDLSFTPDAVCVGKNSLLIANKSQKTVAVLSLDGTETFAYSDFTGNDLTDVCYFDGVYYIAQITDGNTTGTTVFAINETNPSAPTTYLSAEAHFGAGTLISADFYDGIVLIKDGFIYKESDLDTPLNSSPISGVKKIATDLSGNVFALTESGVYYANESVQNFVPVNGGNLKSFTLSYDGSDVFFTINNEERLYKTTALPNVSADAINIPTAFKTSGNSASIETFKAISTENNSTLGISVKDGETTFNYEGIQSGVANEYVFVCEATAAKYDAVNDETLKLDFYVLLGKNERFAPAFYLVKKDLASDVTDSVIKEPETDTMYVTTDVNAYYLPMVANGDFLITYDEEVLRITAKTKLSVKKQIVFSEDGLNEKFYYVELDIGDGEKVYAYIPSNFTVERLSEEKNGDTVVSQIQGSDSFSLRNSLIIIALSASVFGTSIFFILKKKS